LDSEPIKYWDVKKFDVGRELANPDWVQWASEKIKKLEAENKALKRKLELNDGDLESVKTGFIGAHKGLRERFEKLQTSSDELLEALKQYPEGELERVYIGKKFVHVSKIIQRTEDLKEKEKTQSSI